MATRPGWQNFAAMAYSTAGPMVASVPDSEAIMPRRIRTSRAYQLAAVPESHDRMQLSGSLDDISQKTRCGLMGTASCIARASRTSHQSTTFLSIRSRHDRSVFRCSSGRNARSVSALSPTRFTSIG